MNRRELSKFQVPEVRDQYMAKYGDPLEEVSPQDLMDLMENLWTSNRGSYAVLREKMRREGHDPWTVRLSLIENYFRETPGDRSDQRVFKVNPHWDYSIPE